MSCFALLFGFQVHSITLCTHHWCIAVQSLAWLCLWRLIRVVAATVLPHPVFSSKWKKSHTNYPNRPLIFFFLSSYFFLSWLSDCSVRPPLQSQGGFKSSFFFKTPQPDMFGARVLFFFPPPSAVKGRGVEIEKREEAHMWFSPPLPPSCGSQSFSVFSSIWFN